MIESFATFEGIYYPEKGCSISYATKAISYDIIYEFEVESVRRLTEEDKANWVPDWPTGTSVRDHAFGKDTSIDHTKEQLQERMEEYYAKFRDDLKMGIQGKRNCTILIVNVVGILLIFWLFYRKYKAKK